MFRPRLLALFLPAAAFLTTAASQNPPGGQTVMRQPTVDRAERVLENRMADMRNLESRMRTLNARDKRPPEAPTLTKEQVQEIKKRRRVDQTTLDTYAKFLATEKTGIFKLFSDRECLSKNVIRLDKECDLFVWESSGFSFRNEGYSDRYYHDIFYDRHGISSFGFFSQGILTEVGDVPVETIDLSHSALNFIRNFIPEVDLKKAIDNSKQFAKGVDANGFTYADRAKMEANTTYALRHIAYRIGNSLAPLSPSTTLTEQRFLSLNFDTRADSIVVFRVVKIDEDGGATIVWRELSTADAPKIKFPKGERIRDLRDLVK